MKKTILFLFVCGILSSMAWAIEYPISATFTFSTTDAPACGDIDTVVYLLSLGGDSIWTREVLADTVGPCHWTIDTTVTTAGWWSIVAYFYDGGVVVGFGAQDCNVLNPVDFQADVSGCGAGDGADLNLVVCVIDTSAAPDVYLEAAKLTMMKLDESIVYAALRTNADGCRAFGATASTDYAFITRLTGYIFNELDTLSAGSAPGPDTVEVYGYAFDPGDPGDAAYIRIFGTLDNTAGDAEVGAIVSLTLTPLRSARDTIPHIAATNVTLNTKAMLDTTDVNGAWFIDVVPVDAITPAGDSTSGTFYDFIARDSNGVIIRGHNKKIRPTGTENINISDL